MAWQTLDSAHLMQYLVEAEVAAEDLLTDKQKVVDLDRKRQKTREALRVLSKDKTSKKHWVCIGNMFMKLPAPQTKKILEQDFDNLDDEINDTRHKMKEKLAKLRDVEKKEGLKGFDLQPLSAQELSAINSIL